MKLFSALLPLAALTMSLANAAPITLAGGTTTVTLDLTTVGVLTGAGISVAPVGTGSLSGAEAKFPITGGTIDGTNANILHDGSGLRLSTGTATLDLINFIINASITPGSESGTITGDAAGAVSASGVTLFDIGPGLTLTLNSEAAGALTAVFGLPDVTGAPIGVASVAPTAVPEPSSWLLILAGGAGVGLMRSRFFARRS